MTVTATYPLGSDAAAAAAGATAAECQPQQIVEITNHVGIGISRFIEQYKGKPRLESLLKSFLVQVQEIETAAFDVLESTIDTATGDSLAKWGEIADQVNPGLNDANYRVLIRARIRVNRSNGHPDDVIQVLQLVAISIGESPANITYLEGLTSYVIYLDSDIGVIDADVVWELLDDADPAGVAGEFVFGYSLSGDLFRWSSSLGTVTFNGQGFASSVTANQGGVLSSVRGSST